MRPISAASLVVAAIVGASIGNADARGGSAAHAPSVGVGSVLMQPSLSAMPRTATQPQPILPTMSHPIALPQPTLPAMPHSAAQPPQPIAPGMLGAQSQAGAAAVDVAPLGAPISALPFPSTDSVAGCMHAAGASGLSGTIQAGPFIHSCAFGNTN